MSDADRLRRAIHWEIDAPWDTDERVVAVCRAIVKEFGLKRLEVATWRRVCMAVLDVAEADDE